MLRKKTPFSLVPVTEAGRVKLLFKYIVENNAGVAIGPLEYAGNARAVKDSHGNKLFVILSS